MLFFLSSFWFKHLPLKKEPYHYLRFEKDSRYYELRLAQDLLEDWTLITSNGRIRSKLGQSRTQAFGTYNEALTQLYFAIKLRHQRHYHVTQYLIEDLIYTLFLSSLSSHPNYKTKDRVIKQKSTQETIKTRQLKHYPNNSQQICLTF